jgi:hypothetical protein
VGESSGGVDMLREGGHRRETVMSLEGGVDSRHCNRAVLVSEIIDPRAGASGEGVFSQIGHRRSLITDGVKADGDDHHWGPSIADRPASELVSIKVEDAWPEGGWVW